jgi:hypothetical protein
MGRYYFGAKTTVEEATKLSIFKLKEFGLLCGFASSTLTWTRKLSGHEKSIGILVDTKDLYAEVNYTITDRGTGEETDYDYRIDLTTTPCHFGGVRYWFICPLTVKGVYCGRRTGTLYLASGGKYFGCRQCYNLSYDSRNESRLGRIGQLGYFLKAERQMRELKNRIKRNFYAGKPTKKFRRLIIMQNRLSSLEIRDINALLRR